MNWMDWAGLHTVLLAWWNVSLLGNRAGLPDFLLRNNFGNIDIENFVCGAAAEAGKLTDPPIPYIFIFVDQFLHETASPSSQTAREPSITYHTYP